jgi:CDP-diacylglycerol--glycerol-3-phosphate 3-phosphatidyltransferase
MNLPNRLTVGRFFLTILFVVVVSVSFPYHFAVALVLFSLAAITDYVDGEIARRYALITDFGKLMDPLVDKIMTAAAFVCLVPLRAIPAWAAIIVISREFLITGLRLLAISKGRVLSADRIGKHKTSWQIATVVLFLFLLAYREIQQRNGGAPGEWWEHLWSYGGWTVSGIAVGLTLYSGVDYLWRHRAMLETE